MPIRFLDEEPQQKSKIRFLDEKPIGDEREEFAKQYTKEQERSVLSKAGQAISGTFSSIAKPFKEAYSEVSQEGLPSTISKLPATAIESVRRGGLSVLNPIAAKLGEMANDPSQFMDYYGNPIQGASNQIIKGIQSLRSHTPDESEIEKAYRNKLMQDELSKRMEAGTAPGSQPKLAQLSSDIGLLALPGLKGRATPIIEGAERLAGGIKDVAVGGSKMAVRSILPTSETDSLVNALNPKANAINPTKQVQAMKNASRDVTRLLPEINENMLESHQSLANAATEKLKQVHRQRAAMAGRAEKISLDPLADAYEKESEDAILKLRNPQQSKLLKAESNKFRGKTVTGEQAEKLNQELNADSEVFYAKENVKRAVAEKTNPMLRGHLAASQALRSELDGTLGKQFGNLGKDYGAWRNIADMAQREAIRQAKMEGNLGIYEGLSVLEAAGTGKLKSLAAGQVLKYAGSPQARLDAAARRISQAKRSGRIKERPPFPMVSESE